MPGRRGEDMTAVLSPCTSRNLLELNTLNNHDAKKEGGEKKPKQQTKATKHQDMIIDH